MQSITKQLEVGIQNVLKKALLSAAVSDAVGKAGKQIVHENFEAEGRPRWKAWTPAYAEWRKSLPYPLIIGTITGKLRRSVIASGFGGGSDLVANVDYAGDFASIRPIFTFPSGSEAIFAKEITSALNRT